MWSFLAQSRRRVWSTPNLHNQLHASPRRKMASESPAITVPLAAATRPSNLLLTPDPLQSPSSPSPTESLEQRHISDLFREHGLRLTPVLRQAVSEELSKLGVEYECVPSSSKGNKARKSPRPTHRRGSDSITANGLQVHQHDIFFDAYEMGL